MNFRNATLSRARSSFLRKTESAGATIRQQQTSLFAFGTSDVAILVSLVPTLNKLARTCYSRADATNLLRYLP